MFAYPLGTNNTNKDTHTPLFPNIYFSVTLRLQNNHSSLWVVGLVFLAIGPCFSPSLDCFCDAASSLLFLFLLFLSFSLGSINYRVCDLPILPNLACGNADLLLSASGSLSRLTGYMVQCVIDLPQFPHELFCSSAFLSIKWGIFSIDAQISSPTCRHYAGRPMPPESLSLGPSDGGHMRATVMMLFCSSTSFCGSIHQFLGWSLPRFGFCGLLQPPSPSKNAILALDWFPEGPLLY